MSKWVSFGVPQGHNWPCQCGRNNHYKLFFCKSCGLARFLKKPNAKVKEADNHPALGDSQPPRDGV